MDANTLAIFSRPEMDSWTSETALDTAVRAAEHAAFLTAPDCHLSAARAREFYCSLAREDSTRTPRTGRHADYLLADGSGCAHLLAL